jgi:hypothetical protein
VSDYSEFFLSSASSVVQLETFELSHSSFTETYRFVRNAIGGVTVIDENSVSKVFEYYPAKITPLGSSGTLDQSINISLGDLGEIIPLELDAVSAAGTWGEKPKVIYRTYRSDNLAVPLFGPIELEVSKFSFNKKGSSFDASARSFNNLSTGIIFDYTNFPGLRGYL